MARDDAPKSDVLPAQKATAQKRTAEPEATGGWRSLIAADSALAVTARELLGAHTPEDGAVLCPRCGVPDPCPTARHASMVCLTAQAQPPPAARPRKRLPGAPRKRAG